MLLHDIGLFYKPVSGDVVCKKGDVLAVFLQGEFMTRDKYDDMVESGTVIPGYALDVGDEDDIIMDCSRNIGKCLASKSNSNFGCRIKANASLESDVIAGKWIAWLEAIDDIAPGNEICYDYGYDPQIKTNNGTYY